MFLAKSHEHFFFDAAQKPAVTVQPGEDVTFETQDACGGRVRTVEQFMRYRQHPMPGNPLTGPVFIVGAEPGQTLVVEIMGIQLDKTGFQNIGPDRGIIRDEIMEWTTYEVRVRGDRIELPNGMTLRPDPMIGTFGCAPAGRPTNDPNPLGGNLDVPAARTGARLYVPIEVPGALFSLGDVHACQGDGEVVGAPEIGAKVTVRFSLVPGRHSEWCMIEDATHWHSACSAATEAEAARLAVFQNARFIARTHGVAYGDALILLTMLGDLRISRTGKWGTQGPVVCSSFAKESARAACPPPHGS